MKSTNYIVIQGWMCKELGLKGNELLVFALIYGFSQDGESKFSGGRRYISETFDITLPTVDKVLQSLVAKNFIEKQSADDYKHTDSYYITDWVSEGVVKKLYEGSKETLLGGSKETLLNNTNNNNTNTKKSNSKELLQNFQFGKSKAKRPDLFSQCISILDSYDFSIHSDIRKLAIEYLRYRMSIKDKPLYANMWKGMLNKLVNLCDNDIELYKAVIQQSIERGYLAFYPVSVNNKSKNVMQDIEGLNHSESMTEEDYERLDKLTEERRRLGLQAEF